MYYQNTLDCLWSKISSEIHVKYWTQIELASETTPTQRFLPNNQKLYIFLSSKYSDFAKYNTWHILVNNIIIHSTFEPTTRDTHEGLTLSQCWQWKHWKRELSVTCATALTRSLTSLDPLPRAASLLFDFYFRSVIVFSSVHESLSVFESWACLRGERWFAVRVPVRDCTCGRVF